MNSVTNLEQLRQIQDDLRVADDDQDVAGRAFFNLFESYDAVLRGYARRQSVPPDQIDDLVQEVWIAVHRQLPDFRHNGQKGAFRNWLVQLVRGKAVDEVRRRMRHSAGQHQSTNFWDKRADSETDNPTTDFDQELLQQAIQSFYDTAPASEREVFKLYYSQFDESAPPTADQSTAFHTLLEKQSGLSEAASRQNLHRAKVRLREIINRLLGSHRTA